ncbi:MAG: hypothetical protein KAI47_05735, partial [Deltaproteobacteria bacterium]|nr:hypothetical protein [Deltaproteobacteria bacterium]
PPALESGLHLDDHTKKDVVLDGADRSAEVTGRVVDAAGSPLPYSVHVRAFHEGGWLRSTPALTCSSRSAKPCPCSKDEGSKACDGVFSFRIPYGVHNYTVMVEPPPADANTADPDIDPTAIPTLTCTGAPFGIFQPGEKISIEQPLRMPAFAKSRDVELKVESVDDTAVVGAQVIFETDFEVSKFADIFQSCTATYRRSGTTNADGKVTLSLLPGGAKNRSYRLTVVSPQTSPYASIFRSNFEIGSAAGHISVRLDQRYELRGEVIDSLGNGLADTHVEAQGFSPLSTTKNDIHPTTVFATTDAHGAFVLHVDPGSFHLHFVPLPSSAAPRFSALSKTVSGSVAGLVFTAPAPSLLDGRVLLPVTATRSLPMGAQNFTVNAYETIPRSESHSMAVLRGTTIVDDAGAYRLLVPAP